MLKILNEAWKESGQTPSEWKDGKKIGGIRGMKNIGVGGAWRQEKPSKLLKAGRRYRLGQAMPPQEYAAWRDIEFRGTQQEVNSLALGEIQRLHDLRAPASTGDISEWARR